MSSSSQGSYTIDVKDNIITVDCYGPFNKEVVAQYSDDIKKSIKDFNEKPWGTIITYYGNGIFTPEAESSIQESARYRAENGMIALAAIIKNSKHADLQHMQLSRIFQETDITFHVFCSMDNASSWIQEFLAENTD